MDIRPQQLFVLALIVVGAIVYTILDYDRFHSQPKHATRWAGFPPARDIQADVIIVKESEEELEGESSETDSSPPEISSSLPVPKAGDDTAVTEAFPPLQMYDDYPIYNDKSLNYIIPNNLICAKNRPHLLIWTYSAVQNFERRNAIRKTWGKAELFKPANVVIVFSLAVTKDNSLQRKVNDEQTKYGDIVQDGSFIDAYRNLTYKAQSMLRWTSAYCSEVKLLFKLDDDSFLIPKRVGRWLNNFQTKSSWPTNSVIGTIWRTPKPNRGKSKWTATREEWPSPIFANKACPGSGYLLTGDSVSKLRDTIPQVRFLWLEDMYTTGVLAQKAKLNYIDNSKNHHLTFHRGRTHIELSSRKTKYLVGHLPSAGDVIKLWDVVKKFS